MPSMTRLVARDVEIGELRKELRRASQGEFRCVLLSADSGVGKTRLAEELTARSRRSTILSAHAYPLGRTTSFGLWAEALDRYLRDQPSERVSSLCGGFLDDLASLLRSVAAVHGSPPPHEVPRFRIFEGLAVVVRNLAAERPVIIVLDDLHHADASSWEALNYLAHNLPHARVLVVGGTRPAELAEHRAGTDVVLCLEQERALRRLALEPLEPAGLAELAEMILRRRPPDALVTWLAERSRGNPLFALGLLRALLDEGADLSAPTLRYLPEALAERVTIGLRVLDEPAKATLEALVVLARPAGLACLARLTDQPLDRLGEIVHGLVRRRLIVETEQRRDLTYELVHPLVQEAVYQSIGGARRRTLHRLAGQALLRSGRVAEAAPHFARSADAGDEEAIDALRKATRQAEGREAYGEALTILGALAELLPADDVRWFDVLHTGSEAAWVVDDRAQAYAAQGLEVMRAVDSVLKASPSEALRATVKLRLATFLGHHHGASATTEADDLLEQAHRLFDKAGDHQGVLLAASGRAWMRGIRREWLGMAVDARRVAEAAEAAHEPVVEVHALLAQGLGYHAAGAFSEAEAALRQSCAIAREQGTTYVASRNLGVLAVVLGAEGRIRESVALLKEAKSLYPDWREGLLLPVYQSFISWLAGDIAATLAGATETLAANPGGVGKARAMGMSLAALAAAESDRLAEARRYAGVARSAYRDGDRFGLASFSHWADVVIAWREGRGPEALHALRGEVSTMLREAWSPWIAFGLVDLAEMAAESDDADASAQTRLALDEIARCVDRDLYRALSALGSALAELTIGSEGQAARYARQAVESFSGLGYRAFEARALDVLGRSLSGSDRKGALQAFGLAVDTFEACGATWRARRSLEALGRLGSPGRRAVAQSLGPGSLSKREREVARLAAQGLTARSIGEQLSIGQRTVETHLTHVYAKLRVTSKLDLVRHASELAF